LQLFTFCTIFAHISPSRPACSIYSMLCTWGGSCKVRKLSSASTGTGNLDCMRMKMRRKCSRYRFYRLINSKIAFPMCDSLKNRCLNNFKCLRLPRCLFVWFLGCKRNVTCNHFNLHNYRCGERGGRKLEETLHIHIHNRNRVVA
jgi:hypothetical protein